MTAEREQEIRMTLASRWTYPHAGNFYRTVAEDLLAAIDRQRERIAELEEESKAVRELVLPNDPTEPLAELLKELQAWDRHSDANIRNLDRITRQQAAIRTLRDALEKIADVGPRNCADAGDAHWRMLGLATAALEATKEFAAIDKSLHPE